MITDEMIEAAARELGNAFGHLVPNATRVGLATWLFDRVARQALTAAEAAASRSIESVPKGQDADGVPVRVCVAVTEDDEQWSAAGWHKSLTHNPEYYEMNVREAAVDGLGGRSVQFRWVEAVVRKYDASEPIARGVEVEG